MKNLVTMVLVVILLIISYAVIFCTSKDEFYYMTSTGYSNDPRCISDENRDGFTATMTSVREGVVAINVDQIDGEWKVNSPLKLGQKIYIEGKGYYSVEDTGPFTEKDFHFDIWNLDIFYKDYNKAKAHGIERIKVIVLKNSE